MAHSTGRRRAALLAALAVLHGPIVSARAEELLPLAATPAQIERAFSAEPGTMAPQSFDLPPGIREASGSRGCHAAAA